MNKLVELSKEISYALRHAPWEYELEMDEEGWVPIAQLLDSLQKSEKWKNLKVTDLSKMIEISEKKRHEIKDGNIKAFYGHSLPMKISKEEKMPPNVLYHGTARRFLKSITENGLQPQSRQYVHLSQDLETAYKWAELAESAFKSGEYNRDYDIKAFTEQQNRKPKSGFETGFGMFYHAVLLKGVLSNKTEASFLDYYLSKPDGMYYIYAKPLNKPPAAFASREASCYLSALEVLAEYDLAKDKLKFAVDWLNSNKDENDRWDFGVKANDGVYFPLSDSWRKEEDRKSDCTKRAAAFLKKLGE